MTDFKKIYKYNMSFYYQSVIIYLIVLFAYTLVKGEFVDDSFKLIFKDPIIYFFLIIIAAVLIAILYNLFLNRHIELTENKLIIAKKSKVREIPFENIAGIKIFKEKRTNRRNPFRLIRIKLKNRKIPVSIRPYDYENANDLISEIRKLKENLGNQVNV